MARLTFLSSVILPFAVLATACSFNYAEGDGAGKTLPEMVITDAKAVRYESARVSIVFEASVLEVYDADKVWAASRVAFIDYANDGSKTVSMEGSAGLLLLDDKNGVYQLGDEASFRVVKDDVSLSAPDLKWRKRDNVLVGPRDGVVEMREGDGTVLRGSGFFADTLSRTYSFSGGINGEMAGGEMADGEMAGGETLPADGGVASQTQDGGE